MPIFDTFDRFRRSGSKKSIDLLFRRFILINGSEYPSWCPVHRLFASYVVMFVNTLCARYHSHVHTLVITHRILCSSRLTHHSSLLLLLLISCSLRSILFDLFDTSFSSTLRHDITKRIIHISTCFDTIISVSWDTIFQESSLSTLIHR